MKKTMALWLLTCCLVSIARSQATTIELKEGEATVKKNFAPRKKADAHFYHLALRKGRTAAIKVVSNSVFLSEENECGVYFELFDSKGKKLFLGDSPTGIDEWEGEIEETGNYKIKVYMKSRDGVTTVGKMDERIVPDSFVKLKTWDPGTTVAVLDGANKKAAKVIRVAGSNILVLETGKLKVYPKSSCQPAPLVPQVKAGDQVVALSYGITFAGASVSSVDTRNGRIFLRFDGGNKDEAIAFGDVLKN